MCGWFSLLIKMTGAAMGIFVNKTDFNDDFGRQVMLRGVNLAGSSKVPYTPPGATYTQEGFFDHRQVSFIGRPFPIAHADEHLERLREWGFNFLRLVVTWEGIEHAGPGIYDSAYLDYLVEVVRKAAQYGFYLFIDPHQDVWSRFSGGDGAPGWTLEAVGLDITHFTETGAALVHATHPSPYPRMAWHTNTSKLACATMFTLFFAGNDFAPQTMIEGEPAQEYLQRHYIDAISQVAVRVKDQPNVLGYDSLNEPSSGFIGWKDLNSLDGSVSLDLSPTPYQSMLLAAGISQEVDVWSIGLASLKKTGTRRLNEFGSHAWLPGYDCIWKQHGVWDFDAAGEPHLLRPDYFAQVNGKSVSFAEDYYRPFNRRFTAAIHDVHPGALIFIETEPDQPPYVMDAQEATEVVYAPHWYDAFVLVKKEYTPWIGVNSLSRRAVFTPPGIRRSYRSQLATLKQQAEGRLSGVPFVLGEFGIPYDLHEKHAYQTGDFSIQLKALQRSMQAVEDNLLNYSLWNYSPDNTNLHGDQWNDEDLSIYSPDQRSNPRDINSGGRALQAVVRPYPVATAGKLISSGFNPRRRVFHMAFRPDPQITAPTEIFVPNYQYPHGYSVRVSDGRYEIKRSSQRLLYWPGEKKSVERITIKP
ncbi:MAG: glycosyl hydrolase family 35 [Anaerolineales bacterium]|nr:MAG: glycosyl hydrolase family 35 [Anaerolineales bacterium]